MIFDITPLENSFNQNFYCVIFYTIALFIGFIYNIRYESASANNRGLEFFLIGCVFIYCLTSFTNGDYYHYYEYVKGLKKVNTERGLEPIYQYLILFLHNNYLLFRVCVWGLALILYIKTLERFGVNINLALFFLLACFLNTFSYARATLGMAMFFYGYAMFYNPKSMSTIEKIVGIIFMFISMTFHRSMSIMIVIWLFTLVVPFNKRVIVLMLGILPISIFVVQNMFGHFLEIGYMPDDILLRKANGYSQKVTQTSNWKGLLQMFLQYSTFYIPLILMSLRFWFKPSLIVVEKKFLHLGKLVFMTIYLATIFLFIVSTNQVFFYRVLFMTMIPVTILITYMIDWELLDFRCYKFVVCLGILYSYQVYLSSISRQL